MEHAKRLRGLLAEQGLNLLQAAKLLHVSLRTLQNWLSGHHQIPPMAVKLLRLLRYMELPGEAWRGWSFSRGALVTPEGRIIQGRDGAWWSLLVRQAHSFGQLYREAQMAAIERSHLVSLNDENGPEARAARNDAGALGSGPDLDTPPE